MILLRRLEPFTAFSQPGLKLCRQTSTLTWGHSVSMSSPLLTGVATAHFTFIYFAAQTFMFCRQVLPRGRHTTQIRLSKDPQIPNYYRLFLSRQLTDVLSVSGR